MSYVLWVISIALMAFGVALIGVSFMVFVPANPDVEIDKNGTVKATKESREKLIGRNEYLLDKIKKSKETNKD